MLGAGQGRLPQLASQLLDPAVASKHDLTPDSTPSVASSLGTANRSPFRSSRRGSSTPPSIPTEVESRIAALEQRQQQRGVGDVARQRPALVERGGERDHPVAGHAP